MWRNVALIKNQSIHNEDQLRSIKYHKLTFVYLNKTQNIGKSRDPINQLHL